MREIHGLAKKKNEMAIRLSAAEYLSDIHSCINLLFDRGQ